MVSLIDLLRKLPWKLIRIICTLGAVLCVAYVAWFLRERGVRRLPLDHDERLYLSFARYYARSFQKGDLPGIVGFTGELNNPVFAKLVNGVALYLFNPSLPVIDKNGYIIGERLPDDHPGKPLLLTIRHLSEWFGVLAAALLAVINPLAGYFLAVHTFAVKYTSVGYLEAVPSFTSLLCILAFERWDRLRRSQNPRFLFMKVQAAHLWLAISAAALGLSAASKYIYAVAGIAIVVYALWRAFIERQSIQAAILPLFGWGMLALLVFYAADPYIWLDPIGQLKISIISNMNFSSNDFVRSLGDRKSVV
jgi:hypothetical protein